MRLRVEEINNFFLIKKIQKQHLKMQCSLLPLKKKIIKYIQDDYF